MHFFLAMAHNTRQISNPKAIDHVHGHFRNQCLGLGGTQSHHLSKCLECLHSHSYWKRLTFLEGFCGTGWKGELRINSLQMWMAPQILLALAFGPSSLGLPLTGQSTFVFHTKLKSPLLPTFSAVGLLVSMFPIQKSGLTLTHASSPEVTPPR